MPCVIWTIYLWYDDAFLQYLRIDFTCEIVIDEMLKTCCLAFPYLSFHNVLLINCPQDKLSNILQLQTF